MGAVDPPSFADIRLSLGHYTAGCAGSSTQLPELDGHRIEKIKSRPDRNLPDSSAVTTPEVLPDSGLTRANGSGGSSKRWRKDADNATLRLEERQLSKNDWKKKRDAEAQVRAKRREVEDHHKQEEERRRKEVRRMQENVQRLHEEEQLRKLKRDADSLSRKKQDVEKERKRRKNEDDERYRWLEYEDCRRRREGSELSQKTGESDCRRQKDKDQRLHREQHERLTKITTFVHQDADWMHRQIVPFEVAEKFDYRFLLERLYSEHNPAKLADVNQLLVKYAGQEAEMYAHICEKYGVSPLKYVPSASKKRVSADTTVVPSSSLVCCGASNCNPDPTLSPDTAEEADNDLWRRFEVLRKLPRQKNISSACNGVATVEFASASTADSDEPPPLENELWGRFQNLLKR